MITAKQLLKEIVTSLREVIAPAVAEPYAKSQAYMAAVVLEFVARQIDERSDIEQNKQQALVELMRDLARIPGLDGMLRGDHMSETGLGDFIGHLYGERSRLGEDTFAAANQRVRHTLRQLLDEELKIVGKAGE